MTVVDFADYEWLTGCEAAAVLTSVAADSRPLPQQVAMLRKSFSAARTSLLLEQVELRHRGRQKFTQAERMFFTRTGLEQATDEWLARYKAHRFSSTEVVDLCCGVGGDLLAFAARGPTQGVDRDPIVAHFAAANAAACDLAPRIQTTSLAPQSVPLGASWHLDPDRRPTGRRTTQLEFVSPSREEIETLLHHSPTGAIKLAPATTLPAEWQAAGEAEWISRGGECKQLVAWFGKLAPSPGMRRATKVVVGPTGKVESHTFTGEPELPRSLAPQIGRYLFEPDPAILAAHLTGALALQHNLLGVNPGIAYLTANIRTDEPLLAAFEVVEVLPFDKKRLIAYLREHRLSAAEIKVRGVEVSPEQLRKELSCDGAPVTLLLTPHVGGVTAVIARRIDSFKSCSPPPLRGEKGGVFF